MAKKSDEGQQYQCNNSDCSLGSVHDPGLFTGGITKEQVVLLSGDPEPAEENYGVGICPNCGKAGQEVSL